MALNGMPEGLDEQERGRVAGEDARERETARVEEARVAAEKRTAAFELSPAMREAEGTRLQKEARALAVAAREKAEGEAKAKPALAAGHAEYNARVEGLRAWLVGLQLRPEDTLALHRDLDWLVEHSGYARPGWTSS